MRASLETAFRWITQPKTSHSARNYEIDDQDENGGDTMMIDLMVNQVQNEVIQLEKRQESEKKQPPAKKGFPDYSWLISKTSTRRRRYLSFEEKLEVERLCAPIRRNEWSNLIVNWRVSARGATDRTQIISALKKAVDDIVNSRPKKHSFGNVLMNYIRHGQSINSIGNNSQQTEIMELEAVRLNSLSDQYADLIRMV